MSKIIQLTYEDKDYTLEYTQESVKLMEKKGFSPSDIETKPMTTLPLLVEGAFVAHHPGMKASKAREIYALCSNKGAFIDKLSEMLANAYESLVGDEAETCDSLKWTAD